MATIPEPKKILTQEELDELRRQNIANAPDATKTMGQQLDELVIPADKNKTQQAEEQLRARAMQGFASAEQQRQMQNAASALNSQQEANRLADEVIGRVDRENQAAMDKSLAESGAAKRQSWQSALQGLLTPAQQKAITDSVFGTKTQEPEKTELEKKREAYNMTYQEMMANQRQRLENQRTSDARMARVNALGNLLTTMVQPVGWAIGGATPGPAGVEPYDNRQYLEAFNRAVKATNDIRNLGLAEDEFKLRQAEADYKRAQAAVDAETAWDTWKKKKDYEAEIKSDLSKQSHEQAMEKLAAQGENQKAVAALKASLRIPSSGSLTFEQRMQLKDKDSYNAYRKIAQAKGEPVMTYAEYLKTLGISDGTNSSTKQDKTEKKGGFQSGNNAGGEKKGGFQS